MKTLILSLIISLTPLIGYSQKTIILDGSEDKIPLDEWYTIKKGTTKSGLYFATENKEKSIVLLKDVLDRMGLEYDKPIKIDESGTKYWKKDFGDGCYSNISYGFHSTKKVYIIKIITVE
jgi:hypothetical protein